MCLCRASQRAAAAARRKSNTIISCLLFRPSRQAASSSSGGGKDDDGDDGSGSRLQLSDQKCPLPRLKGRESVGRLSGFCFRPPPRPQVNPLLAAAAAVSSVAAAWLRCATSINTNRAGSCVRLSPLAARLYLCLYLFRQQSCTAMREVYLCAATGIIGEPIGGGGGVIINH